MHPRTVLTRLQSDEQAVSPVISVILMVAITVILGAVIATFVLGIGEDVTTETPAAGFTFEFDNDSSEVRVFHASGDEIDGDQLRFTGAAVEKTSFGSITEWNGTDVTAGDVANVTVTGGETLRVAWRAESGSETAILGNFRVPADAATVASISNIDTRNTYYTDGNFTLTMGQIVNTDAVYVEAVNLGGGPGCACGSDTRWISQSQVGQPVEFSLLPSSSGIGRGDVLKITVWESASKTTKVTETTTVVG